MADEDRLLVLLGNVLDVIAAHWPAEADDLPELQYVANGAVPWDGCDTLAASLVRTFPCPDGDPTLEQMTVQPGLIALRCAVIDVYLLRCVPVAEMNGTTLVMPTPAAVEASASVILRDAQALTNIVTSGWLAAELAGCRALTVENWSAAGPEGGYGGGVLRLRVVAL